MMMMVVMVVITDFVPVTAARIAFAMCALLEFGKAVIEHGASFAFATVTKAVIFAVMRQRTVIRKVRHHRGHCIQVILEKRHHRLGCKAIPDPRPETNNKSAGHPRGQSSCQGLQIPFLAHSLPPINLLRGSQKRNGPVTAYQHSFQ